jgi:hypothetical protein
MTYVGHALQWPQIRRRGDRDWNRLVAAFVAVGLAIGAIGYPLTAIVLKNRQQVKKAAAEINAIVPPTETLYAIDPDYQPVFFYVNAPLKYVSHIEKLPPDTHYFIVRNEDEIYAASTQEWAPRRAEVVARVRDYSERELVLFKVAP